MATGLAPVWSHGVLLGSTVPNPEWLRLSGLRSDFKLIQDFSFLSEELLRAVDLLPIEQRDLFRHQLNDVLIRLEESRTTDERFLTRHSDD
jgi:hypothetical protein